MARADDPATWDFATPGPELALTIGVHALASALIVTLSTELAISTAVGNVAPLQGFTGPSPGGLALLAIGNSLVLPVLSGATLYALERNNRLWRIQLGWILLAGLVPEAIAQSYYASCLRGYTLSGGITAPNLFPKLLTAQIAAIVVTPLVQVAITHLLRVPDPDR